MVRIRVLVVDDSVVIRRMLREVFAADPAFEVAGVAANGRIALAMMEQIAPDLVTLDVEMPEMDGLESLRAIRLRYPTLPVVMVSTLTSRGAAETIEALSLGASDYVTKPKDAANLHASVQQLREQLLPIARTLCGGNDLPMSPRVTEPPTPRAVANSFSFGPVQAVVIGTSTGGPNALAAVFAKLPEDLPVPLLVVQHMPPVFTRFLAERLTVGSQVPVREAITGTAVKPGEAWVAPGDYHLSVYRDGTQVRMATDQGPHQHSCRPSVDVLFRSAAEVYGRGLLAVVMTGMGQDGLSGCEHVCKHGGRVIAQDKASSIVWGMPGFVVSAGLADKVLPLDQIGPEIVRLVRGNSREQHLAMAVR